MAETYRYVDPSDAAKAINGISELQYRYIDPSDIVGAIKDADPNVKDLDRSDIVPAVNEVAGGGTDPEPPEPEVPDPVPVLSLWNTNPALVLVADTDISKFADGDSVTMAGVQPPWDTTVNGQHNIANVGVGGDQFELLGVDLTAAGTTISGAGVTVTPAAPPAARSASGKKPTR